MSRARVSPLVAFVQTRAADRCEYCLLHEEDAFEPHEPDHIIARKHGGETRKANLAWACSLCNRHKGSDLTSIDWGFSDDIARLFNPRRQRWEKHFRLKRGRIIGLTPQGRVTAFLLHFNDPPRRVQIRRLLAARGRYRR